MNTASGALTIINAHQKEPMVFWNGQAVPGVVSIKVDNSAASQRVVLTFQEDPALVEMAAAGIIIKRVAS